MNALQLIEWLLQQALVAGPIESRTIKLAAQQVIASLLDEQTWAKTPLQEASVHRSRRSKVWVATVTGPSGGQIWKTTGLTDYHQALSLAQHWAAQAAAQRARLGGIANKPGTRVRSGQQGPGTGQLTQKEVAELLHMSERGVREVERRALQKLRNHPLVKQLWQQYSSGEF